MGSWASAFARLLTVGSCLGYAAGCSDSQMDHGPGYGGEGGSRALAARCTDKPGALRGRSMQKLTAGGLNRSFIYYAPPTLDANVPAPVVIVAHGYRMNADMMFDITKYAELADREGVIVLFPNGQPMGSVLSGPWNVGTPTPDCSSTFGFLPVAAGDDNALLDAMIALADADQCLDREHMFMTGFSMGGYLANDVGCMRPDIRAVAPHSGGSHDFAMCKVTDKPVLLMHFEGDSLIPYRCGTQARDRWLTLDQCDAEAPMTVDVKGGHCDYYNGCQANGQVAMCSFINPAAEASKTFPGHAWSGGSTEGTGASFAVPDTESATELSWSFFKKYAW